VILFRCRNKTYREGALYAGAVLLPELWRAACFLIAGSKPRRLYFEVRNTLVKPAGSGIRFKPSPFGTVRPGLSVADHNKEKKVNSRLLTASRHEHVDRFAVTKCVDSYSCPGRACVLSTGVVWAQAPAAAGSSASSKVASSAFARPSSPRRRQGGFRGVAIAVRFAPERD